MSHLEITITETTPLMLRRAEAVPVPQVHATSQHDQDTATVRDHMTVVTTGGMSPEMHDQETDREPDQ